MAVKPNQKVIITVLDEFLVSNEKYEATEVEEINVIIEKTEMNLLNVSKLNTTIVAVITSNLNSAKFSGNVLILRKCQKGEIYFDFL